MPGKPKADPKLQPGIGFALQDDGSWKPEKIPDDVLSSATYSGFLTINGYRCTVFESPDGREWAQKSVNTPAVASPLTIAARVAARSEVLNAIDAAFESVGVYPPKMTNIGQNKYEGEIDTDWNLTVEEKAGGELNVELNGKFCENLEGAVKIFKSKDKSFLPHGVVNYTPEELLKTLHAQIHAYDSRYGELVSCASPEIAQQVAKAKNVFATHGVNEFADATQRAGLQVVPNSDDIILFCEMFFIDGDEMFAVEGGPDSFDEHISTILTDVESSLDQTGPVPMDVHPSTPSDPTDTLWWDGEKFTNDESTIMKNQQASLASRIAANYLAGNPEDIVSQVSEILNGRNDLDDKYDEEIAEYCEEVRKILPKMQEIFDSAFHEVVDFKEQIPQTKHPKVRQICQEKVSEIMNQAAARIEIISHGLLQELEALLAALEAGVAVREETKTASSPESIARELVAIADAIDASKSPDQGLVAYDLRQVLSSIWSSLISVEKLT